MFDNFGKVAKFCGQKTRTKFDNFAKVVKLHEGIQGQEWIPEPPQLQPHTVGRQTFADLGW